MGMRARFRLGIARDLKQHMNRFVRYESTSCSEKRLYLYFDEVIQDFQSNAIWKNFPVRCVNLSNLLPSSTNKFVSDPVSPGDGSSRFYAATKSPWSTITITDEFEPDLIERRRRDPMRKTIKWAGCFTSGPFLFGGFGGSRSAMERCCSLKSKTKVKNNNYPVIKRIKKDGVEFLFLDGELPVDHGQLYSLIYNMYDLSNRNLVQVYSDFTKNKSKWVSLGGPPGIVDGDHPATFSSLVCNNKLILFWYSNQQGAYCFDVNEKGWSAAPPFWGRSIPFLDSQRPLLVEHDHDHLLLFTFGPHYVENAYPDRSIQVFLMSRQRDTFQALNITMELPMSDVPCDFWNLDDPASTSLDHQFLPLGGNKICLALHKFFFDHLPGTDKGKGTDSGKGYIVLITFEYEIKIQSLDIEYTVLTVRNLEYTGKQDKRKPGACTLSVKLAGAVVL